MHADFVLKILWAAREADLDPAHLADKIQRFCRAMRAVDERAAVLTRDRSKRPFAELPLAQAARQVFKDASVTAVTHRLDDRRYIRLAVGCGLAPMSPGGVRLTADPLFWQDEDHIRHVVAAMIDFWDAEQVYIATLSLPGREWVDRSPWFFWLDWRRRADQPTLIPDVPVAGQPWIERAWHGGVERLWPEHAPWDLVET